MKAAKVKGEANPSTPPADQKPTEYDVTARQRVSLLLPLGDEQIEVSLSYEPNAQNKSFDAHLKEYARRAASLPLSDTDEDALLDGEEAQTDAAAWLFDTLAVDIEGIGEEGEEKPLEWRNIFSAQEKKTIVENAILYVQQLDKSKKGARPSWSAQFGNSTIPLLCIFDGYELETSHVLKKADARTQKEFMAAWMKSRGKYETLFELAPIYDRLKVSCTGYKDEIVPLHHKMAAITGHLLRQAKVLRKN